MGAIYPLLLEKGCQVTLADKNFAHWHQVGEQEVFSRRHPQLDVAFNSIYNLSFPDEHFDIVLALSVLDNSDNNAFALNELFRVLKRNGILLITFPFMSLQSVNKLVREQISENSFHEKALHNLLTEGNVKGEFSETMLLKKWAQAISKTKKRPSATHHPGPSLGGLIIAKQ
jgi:ubiquinone/menaquinone biosynthesis C-methylase UbiE